MLTKIFGGSDFSGGRGEGGLRPLEIGRDPLAFDDHVLLAHARPQRVEEALGVRRAERREAPLDDPDVRDADLPGLADWSRCRPRAAPRRDVGLSSPSAGTRPPCAPGGACSPSSSRPAAGRAGPSSRPRPSAPGATPGRPGPTSPRTRARALLLPLHPASTGSRTRTPTARLNDRPTARPPPRPGPSLGLRSSVITTAGSRRRRDSPIRARRGRARAPADRRRSGRRPRSSSDPAGARTPAQLVERQADVALALVSARS